MSYQDCLFDTQQIVAQYSNVDKEDYFQYFGYYKNGQVKIQRKTDENVISFIQYEMNEFK